MTRKCKNCEGTGERQTPTNTVHCPYCLGSGTVKEWRHSAGDPRRDAHQGRAPQTEENKMKLENWVVVHLSGNLYGIHGKLYGNPITTGAIVSSLRDVRPGAAIKTLEAPYELGTPGLNWGEALDTPPAAPEPADDPGPSRHPYAKAPPRILREPEPADDARTWGSHDGGPDPEITAAEGKRFLHASSGIIYEALGCVWDSGRDRWMLAYKKPGAVRGYAHLPEDFFRPGRFIEVKG